MRGANPNIGCWFVEAASRRFHIAAGRRVYGMPFLGSGAVMPGFSAQGSMKLASS
jgi:hypothetical protein